ncbi:MAG: hypothetical protein ACP5KK_00340 [Candidatus Nanoarchaeia archaeon]
MAGEDKTGILIVAIVAIATVAVVGLIGMQLTGFAAKAVKEAKALEEVKAVEPKEEQPYWHPQGVCSIAQQMGCALQELTPSSCVDLCKEKAESYPGEKEHCLMCCGLSYACLKSIEAGKSPEGRPNPAPAGKQQPATQEKQPAPTEEALQPVQTKG